MGDGNGNLGAWIAARPTRLGREAPSLHLAAVFYSAQTRPAPKRILLVSEPPSKGDRNCLLTRLD